jgi:hypothetical protein
MLLSLATGLLGMFLWVSLIEGFGPVVTALVTSLYFLLMGMWIGEMHPRSLPYAGLHMNILFGGTFLPGLTHAPSAVDVSQALPIFLGPLLALPFSYIGVYIGSRLVGRPALEQAESRGETSSAVSMLKIYGIAFLVGLLGMLLAYASALTGTVAFQVAPGVVDTLPLLVIYPILALLLGRHYWRRWLGVGLTVCLLALLSIGGFLLFSPTSPLRHRGQLQWPTLSIDNDSLLVIVLAATVLLSIVTSYIGSRSRKAEESAPEPVLPAGGCWTLRTILPVHPSSIVNRCFPDADR